TDLIKAYILINLAVQCKLLPDQADSFTTLMADDGVKKIHDNIDLINSYLPLEQQLRFPDRLEMMLDSAYQYYRAVENRSESMAQNVVLEMKRRNLDRCILFTGGFHTVHCMASLKELYDVGSIVITPLVKKLDHEAAYNERLTKDS